MYSPIEPYVSLPLFCTAYASGESDIRVASGWDGDKAVATTDLYKLSQYGANAPRFFSSWDGKWWKGLPDWYPFQCDQCGTVTLWDAGMSDECSERSCRAPSFFRDLVGQRPWWSRRMVRVAQTRPPTAVMQGMSAQEYIDGLVTLQALGGDVEFKTACLDLGLFVPGKFRRLR